MQRSNPIELATCPRVNDPPLRFKGSLLTRHTRRLRQGADLFAELWMRTSGGYTLAFSTWYHGDWQADAIKVKRIEDAVVALEDICAKHRGAPPPDLAASLDFVEKLKHHAQYAEETDAFQHLMGRVLADWIALPHAA